MKILPLIVMVACIACEAAARAQEEGEGRQAARGGLLKRGLLAKGKTTTTTTTPAPQEDAEYEEYEEGEGEAQEPSTEAPPSSTEGKKLVGNGVRPFRSNTDLLEALKRRRAQAAEAKLHGHSNTAGSAAPAQDSTAEPVAPVKSSYMKAKMGRGRVRPLLVVTSTTTVRPQADSPERSRARRPRPDAISRRAIDQTTLQPTHTRPARSGITTPATVHESTHPRKARRRGENIGKKRYNNAPKEVENEEAPAPVKPSRARFGRPASRSIQEDHEEQNESAPAPIRTGRTFPRRGGN